jgi:hypothetical protein
MPKAKSVNKKQFQKLTETEQAKELKRMAKRANVRLSLLEEKQQTSGLYNEVRQSLADEGRNKFYEGLKYTGEQIKKAFNKLSSFLNNESSTLGGVKQRVIDKIHEVEAKGNFDYNDLNGMTTQEKIYASQYLATEANRKLAKMEKADVETHASREAEHYNKATGRKKNRFYRGTKFETADDLNTHLQTIMRFNNSKTSTIGGSADEQASRINKFRDLGILIPMGKEKEFFDFLSSEQFKKMGANDDSTQIAKVYVKARKAGYDVKDITEEFANYLNKNLSLDEVEERLKIAEWQEGGLLK